MANCLFCYQPMAPGLIYHAKCCKKFFQTEQLPDLALDKAMIDSLVEETVNKRIAVTGVQQKLSLSLEINGNDSRLTIVGLWGRYILKPQSAEIPAMPEVEDLTMHLAKLFKISTCQHALLLTVDGSLAYIAKRFDREGDAKIHMEDFCQLGGFMTEQKYDSSYERCGKLISAYCTNKGLDLLNYYELLVFCFLSGNSNMHMKNFSILYKGDEILLSPAYDLINSALVFPQDKDDMAMFLSGRKRKIQLKDFENLAKSLGLSEKVFKRVIAKYTGTQDKVFALIDQSFLSEEYNEDYKKIWEERRTRLTQPVE
ncbi:HipA domain-containing protein [Pedobacter flavus]|uniref:HipA domain-containing protein n=1 Tax=Pedobacter flavus TaxID=3113906 RepID=A0ABU7H1X5_9SPHI|nr:HipA domain-containing protein [Pedobacter sp. VNH31]MEE1885077.1 HipA domain-containing protein [Pedobacter sp. VNH31]